MLFLRRSNLPRVELRLLDKNPNELAHLVSSRVQSQSRVGLWLGKIVTEARILFLGGAN
jgi:hypothetical protein